MSDPDGFLKHGRAPIPRRPVDERLGDFREIESERTPEQKVAQATRCMDCGVPFCQQGCPLGNPIPDFNEAVALGHWRRAWDELRSTNNFPEFTGRVCPAPCEAACVLGINDAPVTIEHIEREIADRAWQAGWARPMLPPRRSGRRVAVVGSGPAGLAAAEQLNAAGHHVVVFEKADRPGGLLRYGIPDFKLDRGVLDRRVGLIERAGVTFRCGVEVGTEPTWRALHSEFDAVLVAIGAMQPRRLEVDGAELDGVVLAMDYLEQQNRVVAGESVEAKRRIDAGGKHVVILGGGDTGSDCLGTALRQGAASLTQIELFERPPESRAPHTPWPRWPHVFRTSSSQEEGGDRQWAFMTTRLVGDGGRVVALEGTDVEVLHDGGGVRFEPVDGATRRLDADLVLLAMGFTGVRADALFADGLAAPSARGAVHADDRHRTSTPGLYVAGDAMRGASLVVWAIRDGREAARAIDADLTGRTRLPTVGMDARF